MPGGYNAIWRVPCPPASVPVRTGGSTQSATARCSFSLAHRLYPNHLQTLGAASTHRLLCSTARLQHRDRTIDCVFRTGVSVRISIGLLADWGQLKHVRCRNLRSIEMTARSVLSLSAIQSLKKAKKQSKHMARPRNARLKLR